jgi:2',3'-cyclic-nucleotide 2'-phosphodiesterase
MCGAYESIIGMVKEEPLQRFVTKMPSTRFEAAGGPGMLSGVAVETDDQTGLAKRIAPVRLGSVLAEAKPDFWD